MGDEPQPVVDDLRALGHGLAPPAFGRPSASP
jgi:hypothetical protein